jgi:hypothetical protein
MRRLSIFVALFLLPAALLEAAPKARTRKAAKTKAAPPTFPQFAAVQGAVQSSLQARKGYRRGDLLSRSDAVAAIEAVGKLGWRIADRGKIAGLFLADSDFLVTELRTPGGTRMMRKVSGTPQSFDRLDRLRGLKFGNRRIRELINNPGGHTLILYLTKTTGGKNLGRYLDDVSGGDDFNKPTGRLYTESQFLDRLKLSYRVEQASRKSGPRKSLRRTPRGPARGVRRTPLRRKATTRKKADRREPAEPKNTAAN